MFPTPIHDASELLNGSPGRLAVKRDDLSSPAYGGNKVRTLEVLFANALEQGHKRIYATGAYGSNHGLATVIHAPRAGLEPGVVLFPQPWSETAGANLRAMLSLEPIVVPVRHWSTLPWAMWRTGRSDPLATVMAPGGAIPLGALGYVSAGLELAKQVDDGVLPRPDVVVVGVGSTCTSAGLLVGMELAARRGGFGGRAPRLLSVRVTPWPVTARFRIVGLAVRTARLLATLASAPEARLSSAELKPGIEVTGAFLGAGYGKVTSEGLAAIDEFAALSALTLDTTYSAKAGAAALALARSQPDQSVLLWSTKSTAPMPTTDNAALDSAPEAMRRWLRHTSTTSRE